MTELADIVDTFELLGDWDQRYQSTTVGNVISVLGDAGLIGLFIFAVIVSFGSTFSSFLYGNF